MRNLGFKKLTESPSSCLLNQNSFKSYRDPVYFCIADMNESHDANSSEINSIPNLVKRNELYVPVKMPAVSFASFLSLLNSTFRYWNS